MQLTTEERALLRKIGQKIAPLGGAARAKKLSPERRKEISLIALTARWTKYRAERAAKKDAA
jgi:hypothetical protein